MLNMLQHYFGKIFGAPVQPAPTENADLFVIDLNIQTTANSDRLVYTTVSSDKVVQTVFTQDKTVETLIEYDVER